MTKTENKREEKKRKVIMPAGIRNKLVAAISMLMVASIMMVSSTYAWFTLSTAPEVKGITTNVGANGNLEMMLLNKTSFNSTEENLGVDSEIGDSMAVVEATKANLKWGNLVDLADQSYGLQSIVINPGRLAVNKSNDGALTLGSSMLKAPTYTSDGRVVEVTKDTQTAGYSATKTWQWDEAADNAYGVRVIGTTSGVTERLQAYRKAISEYTSQLGNATEEARKSLMENGQVLANFAIKMATGSTDPIKEEEVAAIKAMISSLQKANDAAGKAIVQSVLAYNLSKEGGTTDMTDADVAPLKNAFGAADITPSKIPENYSNSKGTATPIQKPDRFDAAKDKWASNNEKITNAQNDINALNVNDYTMENLSPIVNQLLDKRYAKVGGVRNPTRDDINSVANGVFASGGNVEIEMLPGSGIYADIGELVGDYTVSGLKVEVKVNSMAITPNATIHVKTIGVTLPADGDIPAASGPATAYIIAIAKGTEPEATLDASTKPVLTDHFGYALDFGFRTNAAASDLLLQTNGIQRVYSGEGGATADRTQGGGSYMQFTTSNTINFSVDELRALMSALRVVFVEPVKTTTEGTSVLNYNILGVAAADLSSTTVDGVTKFQGGTLLKDGTDTTDVANANGVKVNLYLYNYTYDDDTSSITLNGKKVKAEGDTTLDNTLTALTQNVGKKVTAIVYLDGDVVDNTMVANAKNSMTGLLNLQFASSATLKPMDNTGMRAGGTTGTEEEVIYTEKATAGKEYTYEGKTFTVNQGYTIYEGSDKKFYYKADGGTYVEMTLQNVGSVLTLKDATTGG